MSDRPALKKVLACTSLPSLPTVGVQVLTLTRNPDVSVDQIAKVIETDPALSAKVLRTVNSSVYGLKSPCTTIRRALNYLGLSAVKSIVLGFSLVESTRGVDGDEAFDINDHWRRSIFGAAAARVIAQRVGCCDPEEAFAAALFQDLGALAMFTALGDQYTRAIAPARGDHGMHADLEKYGLGFTHAECGAALANKWRLPDRYVQTIQHHHAPDGADADCRDLVRAVGLGTVAAAALGTARAEEQLPGLLACASEWFGLSKDEMTPLLARIGAASAELATLFGKQVGPAPDSAALMQQANEELVNQQIAAMREAESMRVHNEALVKQTMTDALTGIGNRKRFDDEAARLFAESRGIGRSFGLVMCDGDKFKTVNDNYGHHVGDVVLKELARRIAEALGAVGVACRYGGEEFALLIPGVTLDEATTIAERARAQVQSSEVDLSGVAGAPPKVPITISLGVACNDPGGTGGFDSIEELIKAADTALYAAKRAGRNRVCIERAADPIADASVGAAAEPSENGPAPERDAAALGAGASGAGATAKRVLLVEDDPLAARMILAVLAKCSGVSAEWVRSVPQATKRVNESANSPARALHVLVTDFTVVGGTGLEIIAAVRAQPTVARIPILVVSANAEASNAQRCILGGADGFMSKDNLVQQLPAWIVRALSGQVRSRAA